MISVKQLFLTGIAALFLTISLNAQNQEPLAEQMQDLFKSEPFNLGILLQSTMNFSLSDDGFNNGRRFGLGATRLRLGGTVDGGFNYVLQLDFRRAPGIVDAAVGYRFSDRFAIKTGMQKPDIGLELQPGAGQTDFISRARLVGTMLNARELGVSASGQFERLDYNVAIFNGRGISLTNDDRFMYLAKIGYDVDTNQNSSLYIGANGALNTTQNEVVGNSGMVSAGDRLIYGVFADFDNNSWFGTAEILLTSFDTITGASETITGAYLTIGNKVTEQDEILARWDHISFDLRDMSSNLFVLGWNHQATSLISVQVNALAQFDNNNESFGFAGNLQFHF